MKKVIGRLYIPGFLLLAGHFSLSAQNPRTVPSAYSSGINKSYVRTWDLAKPNVDANSVSTQVLKDVKQATQYLDGLGRPLQTIIKQGSLQTSGGANTDLVTAVEYNVYGREQYKYLSFASSSSDGNFKLDPFQQQASFMSSQYGGQGETFFYGETKFESSPLDRTLESFAAGDSWSGSSWQTNEADRKSVKTKYWINTIADSVKKWSVTDVSNNWGTYSVNGNYAAGLLYKNTAIDENGKQIIEFKDKDGKVILKKVQLTATADDGAGRNYTGWLCTYYIYDNYDNLRCVVQPEGVKTLAGNGWNLTTTILDEQCFRYEYDSRNRMIRKKVSGASEVYMVYDARDRLVMTQDAKLRTSNQWLVTKYDEQNRSTETGLWISTTTFTTHLSNAYVSTSYPVTATGYEELTKTFYDNYDWRLLYNPNPLSNTYNNSFNAYFQTASNTLWPYPQANVQTKHLKGMVTGFRIKVVGTSTYLFNVTFYDEKGRVIQVQAQNITGGTDIMTTQYSWTGQPLVMVQKTEKAGVTDQTTVVVTQMTYDDLGRVVKVEKKQSITQVNGGAMSLYNTIVQNEYDKLGQLVKKKLAPAYNSNAGLETENFDYNIRGWILGMNRSYVNNSSTNFFGFDLGYDKHATAVTNTTYTKRQYNGNISGSVWKSTGDGERRKYDYDYDAANRILKADFTQHNGTNFVTHSIIDFSESNYAYDDNGNILTANRKGFKINASPTIDQLTYEYFTGTNRLKKVTDAITDATLKLGDFKDGTNGSSDDYSYDVNGNLILDNNKAISSISYNHLNLPAVVTVTGKGTITYTYDAAGNRIKKVTDETNTTVPYNGTNYTTNITTTITYLGSLVYETKTYSNVNLASLQYTDRLQFIAHEEGRIRFKYENNTLHYDYFLKDHLGNVRMMLTEEQQTDMYPAATMETASAITEETYYSNLPATRVDAPSGYPGGTPQKVAKVKGDGNKIGPAMILKVMSGDKFNLSVYSYWNGGTPDNPVSPLSDLVNALSSSVGGVAGTHGSSSELQSSGVFTSGATSFLNGQSYTGGRPKAYVNWILFDEVFTYVSSNSGFEQVGASGNYTQHIRNGLTISKSGYLYIYVSNETPNIDVFFDNLTVTHFRGPLLEENHFYSFGLTMAGISSKALSFGQPENKKKYQSYEFNSDFDLNLCETFFRTHDPQLGRFWQIDPKPTDFESIYAAMGNNPILKRDLLGDTVFIDDNGIVTRNDRNEDGILVHPYTYKNKDGKEITSLTVFSLNDPEIDALQLNSCDVGKQLVRFLNEEEVNWILNKAGVSTATTLPQLIAGAHTTLDFGKEQLVPNIVGASGAEGLTLGDSYPEMWDQQGGFIYFQGSNSLTSKSVPTVYNIPDAGNFLFGAAANRAGVDALTLVAGTHINSVLTAQGWDSKADQRAIKQGYMYGGYLDAVHQTTYPLIHVFLNYDKSKPSWFKK